MFSNSIPGPDMDTPFRVYYFESIISCLSFKNRLQTYRNGVQNYSTYYYFGL